jgi:hypothetical protein
MGTKIDRLAGKSNDEILELIKPLIQDLESIENKDAIIHEGEEKYTVRELLVDIKKLTERGKKQANMWLDAEEMIKGLKKTKSKKRVDITGWILFFLGICFVLFYVILYAFFGPSRWMFYYYDLISGLMALGLVFIIIGALVLKRDSM